MIHVFSVSYYYENLHSVKEHKFESFEKACMVVAEMMQSGTRNVYTIVDNEVRK